MQYTKDKHPRSSNNEVNSSGGAKYGRVEGPYVYRTSLLILMVHQVTNETRVKSNIKAAMSKYRYLNQREKVILI